MKMSVVISRVKTQIKTIDKQSVLVGQLTAEFVVDSKVLAKLPELVGLQRQEADLEVVARQLDLDVGESTTVELRVRKRDEKTLQH